MKWYKADLHIHGVLSPCGSLDMSPKGILNRAKEKGLDIIAITDHNSLANIPTYVKTAENHSVTIIPGVEVQTSEEIHIVALFDSLEAASDFNVALYESLLPITNDPDFFGDQVIIDENENIIRYEERALINSSVWSFEETLDKIASFKGYSFPAHVNAHTFSVIRQLGFIPLHKEIKAVEITSSAKKEALLEQHNFLSKYCIIKNSDAHYLDDVGQVCTEYYINEPTASEIALAWQEIDGRKVRYIDK